MRWADRLKIARPFLQANASPANYPGRGIGQASARTLEIFLLQDSILGHARDQD